MTLTPCLQLSGGDVMLCARAGVPAPALAEEPAAVARKLQRAGVGALHVWDLDGLEAGRLSSFLDILDILMAVQLPVTVRAGFADLQEMGQVLSRGAARVVVEAVPGTALAAAAVQRFGARAVAALELRAGCLAACGADAAVDAHDRLRQLAAVGIREVVVIDLDRLGSRLGPDRETLSRLAGAGPRLVVAGGVAQPGHEQALAGLAGITGCLADAAVWLGAAARVG